MDKITRTRFTKLLRAVGDAPVPKGMRRINGQNTNYFFEHSKLDEVFHLVQKALVETSFVGLAKPVTLRCGIEPYVLLHINSKFIMVTVPKEGWQ